MPTPVMKHKGNVRAKGEDVLLTNMYFGDEKSKGGIILTNDDGIERGIKPRWGQVFSIGPYSKLKDDIKVGDWVLMEHGRWSRGVLIEDDEGVEWVIRKADTEAILAMTEEEPDEINQWITLHKELSDQLKAESEERNKAEKGPVITITKPPKQGE